MEKMDVTSYGQFQYSETQQNIIDKLLLGETCLLLGFPGSGKTRMTASVADILVSVHKKNVGITGSTGSAAQQIEQNMMNHKNINAQTVHSFFGFQSRELRVLERSLKAFEDMIRFQHKRQSKSRENLVECDLLIVDEISMLTSEFIYALDITARLYKTNIDTPFGGLPILFVGDFRQLPPVSKDSYKYPFLNPLWEKWITNTFSLNFIMRQQTDRLYTDMILRMSHNQLSQSEKGMLLSRVVPDGKNKVMDPTYMPEALRVFHTNSMVHTYNDAVTNIQEGSKCYGSDLIWEFPESFSPDMIRRTKRTLPRSKIFYSEKLFIGARVILTSNLDVPNGVVNGSTGILQCVRASRDQEESSMYGGKHFGNVFVVKLDSGKMISVGSQPYEICYKEDNKLKCTVFYVPILLSHAMTVHRLQGSTLARPIFYWPFEPIEKYNCHFYVVCTRVTSFSLLHLVCVPRNVDVIVDPSVISYYRSLFVHKISE